MRRVLLLSVLLAFALSTTAALAWLSPMMIGGRGSPPPPPPENIVCALGPNYTGTIPAGATAAGFTHCALNLPFSSTSFTTNTWLDCASAPSPLLYLTSVTSGTLTAQGCGAYSLVTDGGGQVLRIRLPPTTGNTAASLYSVKPDHSAGQLFPPNSYVEITYRLGTQDFAQCNNCDMFNFFIYAFNNAPTNIPWLEWDWMEVYTGPAYVSATGQSCIHSGVNTTYSPAGANGCDPTGYNATGTGQASVVADQTVYHTYGIRLVTDGTGNLSGSVSGNMTKCAYLDTVLKQCTKYTYANHSPAIQDTFALRMQLQVQNVFCPSPGGLGCATTGNVLTGNQDIFIDHILIMVCPAWSPTGITQPGTPAVCLNSTADVTGRLAAAP